MSSSLVSAKSKFFAALFAAIAALALAITLTPSQAFATSGYTIDIYDGDAATPIASIDTDDIAKTASPILKGQFCKNDVWNVVAGYNYIPLNTFLNTYASSLWSTADHVTFTTTDFPALYNKYNGGVFTKTELTADYSFYATTLAGSDVTALPTDPTKDYTYKAVLAFTWGAAAQSGTTTADATSITYSATDYPRLIMGLDGTAPSVYGGNRMPANVTSIRIYQPTGGGND